MFGWLYVFPCRLHFTRKDGDRRRGWGRKRLVGESFAAFPSMVMTPEVIRVRDKPDAERPLKGFTPGTWGQREVKITHGVVLGVNGRYPELPTATACCAAVSCSIVPAIPQQGHTGSSQPPSLCPTAEELEEKHLRFSDTALHFLSFLPRCGQLVGWKF